ncbi:hypothetical protein [Dishui Lake phycodnavirus 3]|nr:hypothetical protein [Dishui Lake phycodnavirus 3]
MMLVIAIILLIIALYVFYRTPMYVPSGRPWTVYGSMDCAWTRKQLDYMRRTGRPFVFVDCKKKECPGIDAFPTLVCPMKRRRFVGYTEI